jgi:hypothetical protein
MEKVKVDEMYFCSKCGAYFFDEETCKEHEERCNGHHEGKLCAVELAYAFKIASNSRVKIRFVPTVDGDDEITGNVRYDAETQSVIIS